MDPIPPQQSPAEPSAPVPTWPARLTGAGLVLVCLLLLACLLSYNMEEMGWSFLNTRNAEAAAAVPCTNVLGVSGLYVAGILYYLLGFAAPYAVMLLCIVGCGMALNPCVSRSGQWIAFGVMLVSACAFLSVQNFGGAEWSESVCLKSVGGLTGYLFGDCIVGALLGPTYAAVIFLVVHAVCLIYFALLTPGQVSRGVGNDVRGLWALWLQHRERKRQEKEARAQEWKNAAQNPAQSPATDPQRPVGDPERQPAPVQSQLPLSATTEQPVVRQQPVLPPPVRQRPPLVIPPRPADHPDPLQPRQPEPKQEAPQQQQPPYSPAPQAPVPPRQRPPLVIPPRPADHPDPLQPRQQSQPRPEPQEQPRQQAPATPVRREPVRKEQPLPPSHGDNLLDLMEGIEDDIERSSFTGGRIASTAVPRAEVRINPRLQAAANRHMGIEESEPEPPVRQEPPVRVQPPAPAPVPVRRSDLEPVEDYSGMYTDYPFPPYSLLNYTPPSPEVARAAEEESLEVQQCLIDTFSNFNIAMEPGEITRGPSLTRYEFYPPKGLRLSRIANLGSDLMLATQTKSVNILAPIPGKNTVGVELENATKESVYLRELLESPAFHNPKLKIPVALGKNVYGEPVIGDLAAMPHALVAGTTGSGKSVCINSMILSMLYKFRPDELRLVLVDPKVVEMQPYRKLPHLACPVVTNPARVIGALRWAVNEMEHRYSMFSKMGVRNFEDFNNRPEGYVPEPEEEEDYQGELPIKTDAVEAITSDIERSQGEDIPPEDEEERQGELDFSENDEIPARLPYIVIIIDELADLMMVVKEDLENYIARLTQKARAAGIHLVAATQTPRSNVVTGLIKANIPCRIALKVASPLDSRIILDTNGAENLLGKGDLIFLPPGGITKLTRAQGAWVSDAEIASIIKFCASHAKQKFDQNVTAEMDTADGSNGGPGSDGENGRLAGSGGGNEDDELYTRCVNLVVTERKASTSLLQRRFSIGYGRAAKIMDMMEARGVISSPQGATRAREVLIEAPE